MAYLPPPEPLFTLLPLGTVGLFTTVIVVGGVGGELLEDDAELPTAVGVGVFPSYPLVDVGGVAAFPRGADGGKELESGRWRGRFGFGGRGIVSSFRKKTEDMDGKP